jgi:hypothetical protein
MHTCRCTFVRRRRGSLMTRIRIVVLAIVPLAFSSAVAFGQTQTPHTITVDITPSHELNSFVPNRALGAGVDRLPYGAVDKVYTAPVLNQMLSAGWQPVSYRQNTELHAEAWHWNPVGSWSDPSGRGYFTGSAAPGEMIRHSYGYPLPHRGVTRNDGTETVGYSRLTDGDLESYWKSNPYLTRAYTGEDDALHPQWVILDLATVQNVDTIRIAWADPFATRYLVQYWTGTQDPVKFPTKGVWQTFPAGEIAKGQGGTVTLRVADSLVPIEFIRIWMIESSNTCDTHGADDPRNCAGYAIREISVGTAGPRGEFHDLTQHIKDQEQTATYCSSIDPWHEPSDLDEHAGDQTGFDLFYTSGVTRGLPAMVPIAMLYGTPEDAAAEIAYLEKRAYPISYVEMGEEPDGQYMLPEDYGALYVQFAAALHKVDPNLKLGGPVFQGVNKDIEVWPDANGKTSWLGRFLDYLKSHGKLGELAFMSYEHYPIEPCKVTWASLYDEADLVSNMVRIWRADGLPKEVPQFITESNIAWQASESFVDVYGALWLADYIGSYLSAGGDAVYYFHYFSLGVHPGCNASPGTFGMFTTNADFQVQQYTSQYFASQLINLEWVHPGDGLHKLFPAASDVRDSAGHILVTSYAALRPDGEWSLLVVNKDQENSQPVRIVFADSGKIREDRFGGKIQVTTFGRAQYAWHPSGKSGSADPDGPAAHFSVEADASTTIELPKASVTVIRGVLAGNQK